MKNTFEGIVCIIFGIVFLIWSIRDKMKSEYGSLASAINYKGIVAGLMAVILGIMILLHKI